MTPDLLYDQLVQFGLERAGDARLQLGWLWRARHEVTFLNFSWGPDEYYVWKQLHGRPRRILSWIRLGLFAGRLLTARMLGYRVVWMIHEVYPPHSSVGRRLDRSAGKVLALPPSWAMVPRMNCCTNDVLFLWMM